MLVNVSDLRFDFVDKSFRLSEQILVYKYISCVFSMEPQNEPLAVEYEILLILNKIDLIESQSI